MITKYNEGEKNYAGIVLHFFSKKKQNSDSNQFCFKKLIQNDDVIIIFTHREQYHFMNE